MENGTYIKNLVIVIMIVVIAIIVLMTTSKEASADITNPDAVGEVSGNNFYVYAKWTYSDSDTIMAKLYLDNRVVVESDSTYGSSGEDGIVIEHDKIESGTYRLQLWSEKDDKEVYSTTWKIPTLSISLSLNPDDGEIGQTIVSTTTLSIGPGGPDVYYVSGKMTITADDEISYKENIGGIIYTEHFYEFFGYTSYDIEPVFSSNGFSFPSKGTHEIKARYADMLANISTTSQSVEIADQFEPLFSDLDSQVKNTNEEMERTDKDLDTSVSTNKLMGIIGIAIGFVGVIFVIIAFVITNKAIKKVKKETKKYDHAYENKYQHKPLESTQQDSPAEEKVYADVPRPPKVPITPERTQPIPESQATLPPQYREMKPQSTGEGPTISACPYCGNELKFPKTPRFCPYCKEQILT